MAPSARKYKSLHGNASKLLQRKTRNLALGKASAKKRDYDTAEPKSDENSGDNKTMPQARWLRKLSKAIRAPESRLLEAQTRANQHLM